MNKSPLHIDILIKDEAWHELGHIDSICRSAIDSAAASFSDLLGDEVSIALIDDAEMQTLNRDFRGKDKPTNVLSFPNPGPDNGLGDIVLARETLIREASERDLETVHHLTHLLVHGFLHLLGYDHQNDDDAQEMEGLEVTLLRGMDIDNPYEINQRKKV